MAEEVLCPICGSRIGDRLIAVRERESGKDAHFDCVLKRLRGEKKVGGRECIYYLGGGTFGVVTERRSRGRFDLVIRERIEYEPRRRARPWHDHDEEDER